MTLIKKYCYQIKPDGNLNGPWELHTYSDVDYAEYNKTQKRVTGCIVTINKFFITCHLQSQKIVTLSVTETEYSEIMEVYCKILFVRAVLLILGVIVEYPITMTIIDIS